MKKGDLVRMKHIGYAYDGELGIILRRDRQYDSSRVLVYFYNYPCKANCYYGQLELVSNVKS